MQSAKHNRGMRLFGRLGLTMSRSLVCGSVLIGCTNGAAGQDVGLEPAWLRTIGVAGQHDVGRGVAMWHDGSAFTIAELRGGSTPSRPRAWISFMQTGSAGIEERTETYQGADADVVPMAIAAANPQVSEYFQLRTAHVAGWFTGESVSFGGHVRTAGSSRDAFIATLHDSDPTLTTRWVTTFESEFPSAALAVDAGPRCSTITTSSSMSGFAAIPDPGPVGNVKECAYAMDLIAVGGYISGETGVPWGLGMHTLASNDGEDAFLVLLRADSGFLEQRLHTNFAAISFGGTGHDRITGVAFNRRDQSIVVTGFFSSDDGKPVDFDPYGGAQGEPFTALSNGGTDIFVAKYYLPSPSDPRPRLAWLYTTGTEGDDSGAGVALDARGAAYITGWKRDPGGSRDIWIAKIQEPSAPPSSPYTPVPAWQYTYTGDGDDAGRGIAVDGIGRVLVTGMFGRPRRGGGPEAPDYCLDFNPTAGVDWHCTSAGGHNIFVTRLLPGGGYDWTFTLGGPYNDVGYGIAVDPANTARIAHSGWFGGPDAPTGHQIDFDSRPGFQLWGTSTGNADAFCSILKPQTPTGIKAQLSLVIDNSGSVSVEDYTILVSALRSLLANPYIVPQDSTVAMNVVYFSIPDDAQIMMPWTVFNSTTAPLFGTHLYHMLRPDPGNHNYLAKGVEYAADHLAGNGIGTGYRNLLVIADGTNQVGDLPAARAYAMTRVDQINAYAVRDAGPDPYITRQYLLEQAVDSVAYVDPPFVGSPENNLGIAAETPRDWTWHPDVGFHDPDFGPILRRLLMRVTVCPGDYNRDGVVDQTDEQLFNFHTANQANPCTPGDPFFPLWCQYADWNMDGLYGGWDFDKFDVGLGLGCPP